MAEAKPRAIEKFGVGRAQDTVLDVLKTLAEKFPEKYFSIENLRGLAADSVLTKYGEQENISYSDSLAIFHSGNIKNMVRFMIRQVPFE